MTEERRQEVLNGPHHFMSSNGSFSCHVLAFRVMSGHVSCEIGTSLKSVIASVLFLCTFPFWIIPNIFVRSQTLQTFKPKTKESLQKGRL